ncbi:acetyltransferase [Dokdonia sp. R78006]|uniref:acetyltransferase n=1 Tax=Dokdonia sp. R78006 TaxID=3093866 RepID=UPI0036D2914F
MKDIVIAGAGGFGREVKFIIDRINAVNPTYNLLGFYDDNTDLPSTINGVPLLGTTKDLINYNKTINVVLGVGVPKIKEIIVNSLKENKLITFPVLIDPSSIIGYDNIHIGGGTVICAGVVVTCDIKIERFVTLNLSCTVGHDTVINEFSSFMPSVNISGEVNIGKSVYVGTGAKIINQLEIGADTIVGAGAVVAKSLPEKCTAVGIPAKPIKFHE